MSFLSSESSRQNLSISSPNPCGPLPEGSIDGRPPRHVADFAPSSGQNQGDHDEDEYGNEAHIRSLGKRRRLATTDFTRRKRTAVACQFCRLRKTKCDNVRPQCGYCVRQKAKCVYGDLNTYSDKSDQESTHAGVSNEQLLDRLDEIKDMLQQAQRTDAVSTPSTATPMLELSTSRPSQTADTPQSTTSINHQQGSPRSPFAALRCESLLRWPSLAGVVRMEDAKVDSFPLSVGHHETVKSQGGISQSSRGISEASFIPLCRKFLAEIHPRNPVLDDRELMRHARRVAENGLEWDSASCLVLLACALASYTTPWVNPREHFGPLEEAEIQEMIDLEDQEGAGAYYTAAQKRIGLLGDSIQDIQCFFFATIFEKFSLRPLRAWFHVQQACKRLEARLLQRGERPFMPFREPYPDNYDLEQRLYWSCFRAESEFVFELGMHPCGLENFSYPDAFPSPPEDLFTLVPPQASESHSQLSREQRETKERGWCYYLSEISARRTMDETFNLLYRHGENYWMKYPTHLVRQYREIEQQVSSWHHHLPAVVQFDRDVIPDEEFAAGLQGRANLWREYALRPVLYFVLHSPTGQHIPLEAIDLAREEMRICATIVKRCAYHLRHGGTWFICRAVFSASCLILAAVLHPSRVEPPEAWQTMIPLAIQILCRWGKDAADIQHMADALRHMLTEVCRRRDVL